MAGGSANGVRFDTSGPSMVYARMRVEKACPVVTRPGAGAPEVLAFVHPLAGRQFVKGSVEPNEPPQLAAARELFEESGLVVPEPMTFLGALEIGDDRILWHVSTIVGRACRSAGIIGPKMTTATPSASSGIPSTRHWTTTGTPSSTRHLPSSGHASAGLTRSTSPSWVLQVQSPKVQPNRNDRVVG